MGNRQFSGIYLLFSKEKDINIDYPGLVDSFSFGGIFFLVCPSHCLLNTLAYPENVLCCLLDRIIWKIDLVENGTVKEFFSFKIPGIRLNDA